MADNGVIRRKARGAKLLRAASLARFHMTTLFRTIVEVMEGKC